MCVFCCEVINSSRIIYKDKAVFAFPTNIPITPGHLIICPVRHVQKVDELADEELLAIKGLIIKIKDTLRSVLDSEGFNVAWNEGEMAGQSVPHLHIHVVPRKTGDSGVYEYEPRKFLYRPGSRSVSPDEELEGVAELIRNGLK